MINVTHWCDICSKSTCTVRLNSSVRFDSDPPTAVSPFAPPEKWLLLNGKLTCPECIEKDEGLSIERLSKNDLRELVCAAINFRFGDHIAFEKRDPDGAVTWAVQDGKGHPVAADADGYQPPRFVMTWAEAVRIARERADGADALELAKKDRDGDRRVPVCPDCRNVGVRNETHDTYACLLCDAWLEPSPDGSHFPPTPEKPSQAAWPATAADE